MSEDDWVSVAMDDDLVVAHILVNLSQTTPFSKGGGGEGVVSAPAALQLDWSVRQRRSKHVLRKKWEPNRASPITPLSWSGGTSSGGFEESGLPSKAVDTASSKVLVTSEAPKTKRSRRKKTLTELKEEESLLLKERRNLRHKLENLRLTLEKQRAANESLKRRKLDLESQKITRTVTASAKSEEFNRNQAQQIKEASNLTYSILPISAAHDKIEMSLPIASQTREVGFREPSFILPDLNLPIDDDSGSDVLYGMS